jgi:AmpD protein
MTMATVTTMTAAHESTSSSWNGGWYPLAQRHPSPNFGPRPAGIDISLIVLHSISLPPGVYGGGAVLDLFCNRLDWNAHPYFQSLRGLQVSAHFFIRRNGQIIQCVSGDARAWHAGPSNWRGRENCNDYAIGIELEGLEGQTFEASQYAALTRLATDLTHYYPITAIAGHQHVAPSRKHDPGTGFDWRRFKRQLALRINSKIDWPEAV